MKQMIMMMPNTMDMTNELKLKGELLARTIDAKFIGFVKYPDNMPVDDPTQFVEQIKRIDPDIAVAATGDILASELIHHLYLSNEFNDSNIELYDLHLESPTRDVIENMPVEILEQLKEMSKEYENKQYVVDVMNYGMN